MRFDLDKPLIDEILFCMENQDGEFLLDTVKKIIINTEDFDEEDFFNEDDETEENEIVNHEINEKSIFTSEFDDNRYINLPEWDSNDGYRLMEKFVNELNNPVIREELSDALNRKKGVFRAFRNVLAGYPEAEKKWYSFKESEMKKEVILWYNALREEWGLEPVGIEPEDNLSLVLEDFVIKKEQDDFSFIAETVNGDFAGCVNANLSMVNEKQALHINHLEVVPVYRGMGLGKTLLSKILEKADTKKLDVSIDLPLDMEFFSRSLLFENFQPVVHRFLRKSEK